MIVLRGMRSLVLLTADDLSDGDDGTSDTWRTRHAIVVFLMETAPRRGRQAQFRRRLAGMVMR